MESKRRRHSATYNIIPEDLIMEIFLRLPLKSVLKFRCVSKSWCRIISSKQFVDSHLAFATNHPHYIHHKFISLQYEEPSLLYIHQCPLTTVTHGSDDETNNNNFGCFLKTQIDYLSEKPIDLIGCCNGLCCVSVNGKEKLFLWNPSTRVSRELPPYYINVYGSVGYRCVGYRPLNQTFGFGFHGGDYKVFAAFRKFKSRGDEDILNLYSLRSNSWKRINTSSSSMHVSSGKFGNGKLYCCGFSYFDTFEWNIVYYGLESEDHGTVALPPGCLGLEYGDLYLEEIGERLCLVGVQETSTDVWVMAKDHSWSKPVSVYNDCQSLTRHRPVWMSREGELLNAFYKFKNTGFMIHNAENNSGMRSKRTLRGLVWKSGVYVSSLVSPFQDDDDDLKQDVHTVATSS